MALSPGAAGGFYAAMGGYYIENLKDRSFFPMMLLCYCTPAPIVSVLQQLFDKYFDEAYSTSVTYSFRIITMQLVLGGLVIAWIFSPVASFPVLALGFCIGLVFWTILSSSLQLVSATDPTHIVFVKLGMQLGGFLPTVVLICTGFNPSSSKQEFQYVLSSVVILTVLASCILAYFHKTSDIFTKAYERLSYEPSPPGGAEALLDSEETDPLLRERQVTPTTALDPEAAKHGVPSWIKYWQGCNGLVMGMSFCLLSLCGYFGDAQLTQNLALMRLLMEFVGRIISCVIPWVPGFSHGPCHRVMAASIVLIVGLCGVCFAKLFGVPVAQEVFLMSWCFVFAMYVFVSALLDVTAGCYVNVCDRKPVARMNQMILVSCMLVGLITGQGIGRVLDQRLVAAAR